MRDSRMNRTARIAWLSVWLSVAVIAGSSLPAGARGGESEDRDIPAAFLPLEYLVGRWNGQGIPKDNAAQQFRGWTESHTWAWIFHKGKPAGLAVTVAGGKVIATGKLVYDPTRKRYRLEGTAPKP